MAESVPAAQRALVLGGGGLSGIAWETGVLAGLAAAGADVSLADFVLGTSAGATVAAQLGSGLPLAGLFERQTVPALQSAELAPDIGRVAELMESWQQLPLEYPDPAGLRREVGQRALAAATVPEAERRAVIAGRLPRHSWPTRKLAVVAVEAHTGDVRVFDKDSGADLVDAVTASCAIPGIWPPVTIGAGRYIDGGTRSAVNADLAAGYQRVLILAPMADPPLDEQVAGLTRAAGAGSVLVLAPDDESLAAMGINPLDPAVRAPVAQAGYAQGERAAAGVARLWQLPGR
ncbi:MAG TPA: patatin-like phospholipase family protein [Streptosporangiaceae bacterium]|jgi:NTE family protein